MVSIEECKHIEELSKLKFSDDEREKFIKEFDAIINFASQISNAESNIENRNFNKIKIHELREDEPRESLSQDEVVSNAPSKKKGCFLIPKIMD